MQDVTNGLAPVPSDNIWHAIMALFISVLSFFQGLISVPGLQTIASFIISFFAFLACCTVLVRFYWDASARYKSRKKEASNYAKRRRES